MTAKKPVLSIFDNPLDLARSAAEQFAESLHGLQKTKPVQSVALPGGRICAHFFPFLRQQAEGRPGLMDSIHFFWSDERCVPPGDPESNYGLADGALLRPARISRNRIHRIKGECEPAAAAAEAEAEMRGVTASVNDVPMLDYVFLGMGEDGHVASLFPGEGMDQINSKAVYRAVVAPKPPPNRVTLGYAPLWSARELWILISGKDKSDALKRSLSGGGATPLGRVLANCNQAFIFADCGGGVL